MYFDGPEELDGGEAKLLLLDRVTFEPFWDVGDDEAKLSNEDVSSSISNVLKWNLWEEILWKRRGDEEEERNQFEKKRMKET